eukprot:UN21772
MQEKPQDSAQGKQNVEEHSELVHTLTSNMNALIKNLPNIDALQNEIMQLEEKQNSLIEENSLLVQTVASKSLEHARKIKTLVQYWGGECTKKVVERWPF